MYKEVRVQTSRGKVVNTQLSTVENGGVPLNTMFMGMESLSRRRSQESWIWGDSICKEEDITEDMIGLSLIVAMEDNSHKMVELVTFIENIPYQGQDMANLVKVNWEIEVNKQRHPLANIEKTIFLMYCVLV